MDKIKPGRELDKLVAKALGQPDFTHKGVFPKKEWFKGEHFEYWVCPQCDGEFTERDEYYKETCYRLYSTDITAAMNAWEWLEHNNPWRPLGKYPGDIHLSRYCQDKQPAVIVIGTFCEVDVSLYQSKEASGNNFAIVGETYAHAICLAVLEAASVRNQK